MVQAVDRAVRILELCADGPADINAIAGILDVHRTTALRIIQSLEAGGLLKRDAQHRFRIGYGLHALATRSAEDVDLRSIVHPHLLNLAADTGFAVHCAVPIDDRIVSLDLVEPPYSIRLPLRIGGNNVIHTAGVAKAILAHLDVFEADRILDNATWEKFTERTITRREEMQLTLSRVRTRGWAYDDGEFEDISNCIAAPFFDHSGRVLGAFSLTCLKAQTPLIVLEKTVPRLQDEMRELSLQLGYDASSREREA